MLLDGDTFFAGLLARAEMAVDRSISLHPSGRRCDQHVIHWFGGRCPHGMMGPCNVTLPTKQSSEKRISDYETKQQKKGLRGVFILHVVDNVPLAWKLSVGIQTLTA
jgi:hypothetical protein